MKKWSASIAKQNNRLSYSLSVGQYNNNHLLQSQETNNKTFLVNKIGLKLMYELQNNFYAGFTMQHRFSQQSWNLGYFSFANLVPKYITSFELGHITPFINYLFAVEYSPRFTTNLELNYASGRTLDNQVTFSQTQLAVLIPENIAAKFKMSLKLQPQTTFTLLFTHSTHFEFATKFSTKW